MSEQKKQNLADSSVRKDLLLIRKQQSFIV